MARASPPAPGLSPGCRQRSSGGQSPSRSQRPTSRRVLAAVTGCPEPLPSSGSFPGLLGSPQADAGRRAPAHHQGLRQREAVPAEDGALGGALGPQWTPRLPRAASHTAGLALPGAAGRRFNTWDTVRSTHTLPSAKRSSLTSGATTRALPTCVSWGAGKPLPPLLPGTDLAAQPVGQAAAPPPQTLATAGGRVPRDVRSRPTLTSTPGASLQLHLGLMHTRTHRK